MTIFARSIFGTMLFLFVSGYTIAQNGIHSSGGDGAGSEGTFSYSFGQFSYQSFSNSNNTINQGVQLPFEFELIVNGIPLNEELADLIITAGEVLCYNAQQNITIAGNGSVIIQNTATVDFIAGNSISLLPGFHAESGSFAHAYITTNSSFCGGQTSQSIVQNSPESKSLNSGEFQKEETTLNERQIKVYPNPSNGLFKIDLINFDTNATVMVYNAIGNLCYKSELRNVTRNEINLQSQSKGIYFVKVISNNEQFVKKIITN